MHPKLYKAVTAGDTASLRELASLDSTVLFQVRTQEDNILHVAAKYDKSQMIEEIIKFQPSVVSLVNRKNSKGDTPLHIAARLGRFQIAQILIKCANKMSQDIEAGETLLRMVNMEKDTALHDATKNGHLEIVNLLIETDPELTRLRNDAGESPLFVAVDQKYVDIAKRIMEVAPDFSRGRNNMNALHAAVIRSQDAFSKSTSYLLESRNLIKLFRSVRHLTIKQNIFNEDFIRHLTKNCQSALSETDECEWTPLHYAVHFGAVDIVNLFLKHIDSSATYIRDKEGMSLVHIAAKEGDVTILKTLANRFPEIWDLQDNKGQTVLHHAVARRNIDSVKFILDTVLSHDGLINQKDNEGNTALHLTAILGIYDQIFKLLLEDKRVNKTVINMEGLTVIDILLLEETAFRKIWIIMSVVIDGGMESLEHAINKDGRRTRLSETRKLELPQQSEGQEPVSDTKDEGQKHLSSQKAKPAGLKKASYDQLKDIAETDLVVTTLIATVSFAASFTMPGGYKNDGTDEGMAILSKKSAFMVFVIANIFAFCLSTASMLFHYWQSIEKKHGVPSYTFFAVGCTWYAIMAMMIAFLSGTYATLADSPGLAKAALSVGCPSYILWSLAFDKETRLLYLYLLQSGHIVAGLLAKMLPPSGWTRLLAKLKSSSNI